MTTITTNRLKRNIGKVLLTSFLLILAFGLVLAAVEVVRPGLVRGKLYTAYFVGKAATWEWEYPSGMPDTRAIDRVVTALLAPEIARKPAKIWHMGAPEPFEIYLPQTAGGLLPVDVDQTPLSPSAVDWKYLENGSGSIQGTDWHALTYDDSAWKTGQPPLGFTAGNVSTQLANGYVTTLYLRRNFRVEDPYIYRYIDVELLGGEGAIVYLNGVEVFRKNLPSREGPSQTKALTPFDRPNGTYYLQTADADLLLPGWNVLAVELHWADHVNLNDRFDLILRGALQASSVRFAVIGDFGTGGKHARAVADLVKRWDPYFIITTGDNNYSSGEARTIDKNVGQFYHEYIAPYYGRYGPGADRNRFFPTMGNHDWSDNNDVPSPPNAYINYFNLPPGQGNERYYDFQWGPIHFFALDSDINEPDGITSTSVQGRWLQEKLGQSNAPWKLVYMHHPPFSSSDTHPPTIEMNWPFAEWGASLVISGHNHFYERIEHENIPYFINGTGGGELYGFGEPITGSQARFTGDYGAMLVQGGPCNLHIWFITVDDAVMDSLQMVNAAPACQVKASQEE